MSAQALPLTPDFGTWPVLHRIAEVTHRRGTVDVVWDDGKTSRFHFRWLRDMCPCRHCHNPVTREQSLDISTVPRDIAPLESTVDACGALAITWSHAAHASRYHPGWLRANDYSSSDTAAEAGIPQPTWDAGFAGEIPTFDAAAVLTRDEALYQWLQALRRFGLTRLRGLAARAGQIERVAARIGVIRESNFGRIFDVCSKPNPDSNAYTPVGLLPHTDLPTRELQPGIQILHCLVNEASGGESVMVDGFRLAEVMRTEYPEAFDVLTRVPIVFANRSARTDYRWQAPMIVLDQRGAVSEIRPGVQLRAPVAAPFEEMEALYDGIQTFFELTRDSALRAEFPIQEGDVIAFDNRRILHARNAYDPSSGGRHLQGCYLDRDELLSRIRVLERHLGRTGFAHG